MDMELQKSVMESQMWHLQQRQNDLQREQEKMEQEIKRNTYKHPWEDRARGRFAPYPTLFNLPKRIQSVIGSLYFGLACLTQYTATLPFLMAINKPRLLLSGQ